MAVGDGLISMMPSSVEARGTTTGSTSISINSDGGVNWVDVDQIYINGVFTSEFSNYIILYNYEHSYSSNVNHLYRFSTLGTVDISSTYVSQNLGSFGSTVSAVRVSASYGWLGYSSPQQNGMELHIYGPSLPDKTALRSITNGARLASYPSMADWSSTVSSSSEYDGFVIYSNQSDSGTLHVFGYEE